MKNMFHKIRQAFRALKYQRPIRALVSTQLSILENGDDFACGGVSDEEEQGLAVLLSQARTLGTGNIIEFGTLFGVTTLLLVSLKGDGQKIITVDNFCWNPFGLRPEQHKAFTLRFLRYGIASGDVELVAQESSVFRNRYEGAVPLMVFFDADHSYEAVRKEIAWAKELGVRIISGHDYGNLKFGVTRAVDEAFPQGVEVHGSVWWKMT